MRAAPSTSTSPASSGATASAAVVNLTAVDACGPGFLTAYACGTDVPVASNVNYDRGSTRANLALVVLGQDRHVCVYSYATTDVVVDLSGWLATDQGWRYEPLTPSRLIDTRDAQGALSNVTGRRAAGSTTAVTVTSWPGAPLGPCRGARQRHGRRGRRARLRDGVGLRRQRTDRLQL